MVANVGDQSYKDAIRLKEAGFSGVHHAVRLREGTDTSLSVEKRIQGIRNFEEAGLKVGTCIEPVGPDHSNEELAETIKFTASFNPAFSGASRRIPHTWNRNRQTWNNQRDANGSNSCCHQIGYATICHGQLYT